MVSTSIKLINKYMDVLVLYKIGSSVLSFLLIFSKFLYIIS